MINIILTLVSFYSVDIIEVILKIDILRQSLVSLLYSHLSIYLFFPIISTSISSTDKTKRG